MIFVKQTKISNLNTIHLSPEGYGPRHGVFAYVIRAKDMKRTLHEKKGTVTLVRYPACTNNTNDAYDELATVKNDIHF